VLFSERDDECGCRSDAPQKCRSKFPQVNRRSASRAEPDPLAKRETLELMRAYYRIADPGVRRRMFKLIKALAKVAG
jgi:hypothetical protein